MNPSTVTPFLQEKCHIDKIYIDDNDFIEIAVPNYKKDIGTMVSGGVDSALVAYLLAYTVKKYSTGTKIFPITTEFMARPCNIKGAYNVLRTIENLLDMQFGQHLIFPTPNHLEDITDEDKKRLFSLNIDEYRSRYHLLFIGNGLTANPPIEEVPDTNFVRQIERDDREQVLKKLDQKTTQFPLLFSDKKAVGKLYKKLGLIDTLFPVTRSCEAETEESKNHTLTCFDFKPKGEECWWCRERAYGFKEYKPELFNG